MSALIAGYIAARYCEADRARALAERLGRCGVTFGAPWWDPAWREGLSLSQIGQAEIYEARECEALIYLAPEAETPPPFGAAIEIGCALAGRGVVWIVGPADYRADCPLLSGVRRGSEAELVRWLGGES